METLGPQEAPTTDLLHFLDSTWLTVRNINRDKQETYNVVVDAPVYVTKLSFPQDVT